MSNQPPVGDGHAIPIFETTAQTTDLEDVFLRLIARSGTEPEVVL